MATAPHPRSSLRRTACDRCRHSKLRCPREDTQQKCTRCSRLGLSCEAAPAKRSGRPRKTSSAPATATTTGGQPASHANSDVFPAQDQENLSAGFTEDIQSGNNGLNPTALPHSSGDAFFNLSPIPPPSEPPVPEWYGAATTTSTTTTTSSNPFNPLDMHSLLATKLDQRSCMRELSQLNIDLHDQWKTLQDLEDAGKVKFATFVDHPPPPVGDGVSVAEKLLLLSQRFQQAIANLTWVLQSEDGGRKFGAFTGDVVDENNDGDDENNDDDNNNDDATPTSPIPTPPTPAPHDTPDHPLPTPFTCLLTSCFVQTISLWELMFMHVQRRTSGIDRYPLFTLPTHPLSSSSSSHAYADPSKGIQMGAFYIWSGRLQGMFFCQAVLYFVENIERGLGALPEQQRKGGGGLLSHPRNHEFLQRELGGSGVGMGKGAGAGSDRVRALKSLVEKSRLCSLRDVTGL